MKRIKYLICILAVALLTVIPALAAEGEDTLVREYVHVELFQDGSLSGEVSIPNQVQLFADSLEDRLYERLYQGLKDKQESINVEDIGFPFSDTEKATFKSIYVKVVNDHPELYYLTQGFEAYGYPDGCYAYVNPTYNDLLQADASAFDEAVADALSVVDESMSDLEKALALHDYLALHVAYNWKTAGGTSLASGNPVYSAYGALVNGDAVCQGYALAYQLLLNECGISNTTVTSDQLKHMWNAVRLENDPNWYYVDVTWDDPIDDRYGRCKHDNFLLSEDGLKATGHMEEGYATDWSFNPDNDTSTKYESGWAFNDVDTALYHWGDGYYYIRNETKVEDGKLYLTGSSLYYSDTLDISDNDEEVIYDFGGSNMGIMSAVWVEDEVYGLEYFDQDVVCVELGSKTARTVWTGDPQGGYAYGLRYNVQTDEIEIWSDLSRTDGSRSRKGAFELEHYPSDWNEVSTDAAALAGARWMDDSTLQIGVVYVSSEAKPTLWAATYHNGRMTGVNQVDTSELTNGLNILELRVPSGKSFDTRLFLLSKNSCIPVGNMVTVP